MPYKTSSVYIMTFLFFFFLFIFCITRRLLIYKYMRFYTTISLDLISLSISFVCNMHRTVKRSFVVFLFLHSFIASFPFSHSSQVTVCCFIVFTYHCSSLCTLCIHAYTLNAEWLTALFLSFQKLSWHGIASASFAVFHMVFYHQLLTNTLPTYQLSSFTFIQFVFFT